MDLFPFAKVNPYIVMDDDKYLGWIYSWGDIAGLSDLMVEFLSHLLVWAEFPVIWLNEDEKRENAPIFIVAAYRKTAKPRNRFF